VHSLFGYYLQEGLRRLARERSGSQNHSKNKTAKNHKTTHKRIQNKIAEAKNMAKIYKKVKPQEVPIVGCKIDNFVLKSNRGVDEGNGNLEQVAALYKADNEYKVFYLGIDHPAKCQGITIEQAEEIVETLQSMIKQVKGE
jgi:hypothetical protein